MILSVMYLEAKATPIHSGAPSTETNRVGLMPIPTSINKIVSDRHRWTVTNQPIQRVLSFRKASCLILFIMCVSLIYLRRWAVFCGVTGFTHFMANIALIKRVWGIVPTRPITFACHASMIPSLIMSWQRRPNQPWRR